VFPVGAAPRLYNEDLKQLESELSRELSTAKISEEKWQFQQRIELRESPELAVGRIMARKELGCAKKTSCVI
jgi:hypothetical protein